MSTASFGMGNAKSGKHRVVGVTLTSKGIDGFDKLSQAVEDLNPDSMEVVTIPTKGHSFKHVRERSCRASRSTG